MRPQALGLSLHGSAAITLEIGSRFFVDSSQSRELRGNTQKAAHSGDLSDFFSNLAGAERFELPNARTKTWCLTTWRRPKAMCAAICIAIPPSNKVLAPRTTADLLVLRTQTAGALPLGDAPI